MPLIPFETALERVLASAGEPLPAERVTLANADGCTLAEALHARRTQPPFAVSAMDGYAVRAADLVAGTPLALIGESAAGHRFAGAVGPGETVRIFTGAILPEGADTILIQENARRDGDQVIPAGPEPRGRFVRAAGLDFREGDALMPANRRLDPRDLALLAAMNHAEVPVRRTPLIAILATGDELVQPGEDAPPEAVIASNTFAVAAMARRAGATTLDLGIAADTMAATTAAFDAAARAGADVLVTLGGASVGDHDLIRPALAARGGTLDLWRIAMRPGKPLTFGHLGPMRMLGLPGNPVSAVICARLFLEPLIAAMLGRPSEERTLRAILGTGLPANDERRDYLRASLREVGGSLIATPASAQDSSMLGVLARADALIVRSPHAPAAGAGDPCEALRL